MIRPREDLAGHRADMANWLSDGRLEDWQEYRRDWVQSNDACRKDILDRLTAYGALRTRDLPDSCVLQWLTSGWSNGRNLSQMLGFMVQRGEVAVASRQGHDRLWDLASRVYPDEPVFPAEEAVHIHNTRRLHALGIARLDGSDCPVEPLDVGEVGVPARIDGVSATYRLDPSWLGQPFRGRTVLLSPFDRLIHDRKRMTDLFDFDYQLEMFKPAKNRRWGYYRLPILHGDRLVGKVDATADRKAGRSESTRSTKTSRSVDPHCRGPARVSQPGPVARAGPHGRPLIAASWGLCTATNLSSEVYRSPCAS